MPRRFISFTEDFDKAVADYQRRHSLNSWSQAVVELAAKQLKFKEEAAPSWGGNRRENTMNTVSHVYFAQQGSSSTLRVRSDQWYAVHEAWEGSNLLNTSAVAGPFDTFEEANTAADTARKERESS
jgi:hypothetical protein